jgi:hypothetical protein
VPRARERRREPRAEVREVREVQPREHRKRRTDEQRGEPIREHAVAAQAQVGHVRQVRAREQLVELVRAEVQVREVEARDALEVRDREEVVEFGGRVGVRVANGLHGANRFEREQVVGVSRERGDIDRDVFDEPAREPPFEDEPAHRRGPVRAAPFKQALRVFEVLAHGGRVRFAHRGPHLRAHEPAALRLAVLFEPVGVDQAHGVVVRGAEDARAQRVAVATHSHPNR